MPESLAKMRSAVSVPDETPDDMRAKRPAMLSQTLFAGSVDGLPGDYCVAAGLSS